MTTAALLGLMTLAGPDAKAPEFRLPDSRGVLHSRQELAAGKPLVLAFLGAECPLARQAAGTLVDLCREFGPRGVAFVAIGSNQQDSMAELGTFAANAGLPFPILKDAGNQVADGFGAVRTPEVFLCDKAGVVVYRGRVDDQHGIGYVRPKPTRRDLAEAMTDVLEAKPVRVARTPVEGCRIGRVTPAKEAVAAAPTYWKEVAPILQKRCEACHRSGEVAPFALETFSDAQSWAETVLEVVDSGRMPPWHADPKHGKFSNDARLSDAERKTLHTWVEAGCPEGDVKHRPAPVNHVRGWQIGTPDMVVRMPKAFSVPSKGTVEYQYFTVDPKLTEDKWVTAAEIRIDNRAVVHHIIIFVQPPSGVSGSKVGERSEWLTATAPGGKPLQLTPGLAKFIPKGSRFVFQVHYTPNGVATKDQSYFGLKFADPKTVKREVFTGKAHNERFALKPGERGQKVEGTHRFADDTVMLAMFPHMHLRGQAFNYTVEYPDGKRETLLDIPAYDFAWQNAYILASPKLLPAGTVLRCTALFDNSRGNRSNPDPTKTVRWGDQTWEEMMIGYFDAYVADQDLFGPKISRREKFLQLHKAGKSSAIVAEMAKPRGEADPDKAFAAVADALRKALPQLDRVDLVTVADGNVKFLRRHGWGRQGALGQIAQYPIEPGVLHLPGGPAALPGYLTGKQVVVNANLADATAFDLRYIGRSFGSSAHLPIGKDGTRMLNLYSKEKDAFPPEAIDLVMTVAAAAGTIGR